MNKVGLFAVVFLWAALGATTNAQPNLPATPAGTYDFDSLFAGLPTCNGGLSSDHAIEVIDGGFWPAGGPSLLQSIKKPHMGRLERLDRIATDDDRLWLKALAARVKKQPSKTGPRFMPTCKIESIIDLGATELNEIFACLYEAVGESVSLPSWDRKQARAANRLSIADEYLRAPTRYVGTLQAASTPLGPGFALKVWALQRFDPEWQWALSECTFLMHYQDGFLDGLAVHTARIDGKYSYEFYGQTEQIKIFQWTGEGRLLEVEIMPSEGGEEAIDFGIRRGVLLQGAVEE